MKTIFPVTEINLPGATELVVIGGRDKFPLLAAAFGNTKVIGVIGWGSQGPAQAPNLDESLEGTDIKVMVGLQEGSSSFEKAAEAGFMASIGNAGEMYEVIGKSDLVLLLIKDAAQAENFPKIQAAMKTEATLGLSHGFLVGHMKNVGAEFRKDINVIGVCPKGMGPSVRRLYEQGRSINGAGINSSYAVFQDYTGTARDIALAWAVAIGSPYVFETTLEMEYRSDIFGERGVLLGGVWGALEALYSHFVSNGTWPEAAFVQSVLSLTGPISQAIARGGLVEVATAIPAAHQELFFKVLDATYLPAKALLAEIYAEVSSGREIASVVDATARLKKYPFSKVDGTPMWRVGETVRASKTGAPIHPLTAGVYLGIMMAQVDILLLNKHGWSEICNETIIEAVDSLNPYMAARGVDYMIDNCSTTARLGTRKWGPRFAQMVSGDVLQKVDEEATAPDQEWFWSHPVHIALAECMKMCPPVNISVT